MFFNRQLVSFGMSIDHFATQKWSISDSRCIAMGRVGNDVIPRVSTRTVLIHFDRPVFASDVVCKTIVEPLCGSYEFWGLREDLTADLFGLQ